MPTLPRPHFPLSPIAEANRYLDAIDCLGKTVVLSGVLGVRGDRTFRRGDSRIARPQRTQRTRQVSPVGMVNVAPLKKLTIHALPGMPAAGEDVQK